MKSILSVRQPQHQTKMLIVPVVLSLLNSITLLQSFVIIGNNNIYINTRDALLLGGTSTKTTTVRNPRRNDESWTSLSSSSNNGEATSRSANTIVARKITKKKKPKRRFLQNAHSFENEQQQQQQQIATTSKKVEDKEEKTSANNYDTILKQQIAKQQQQASPNIADPTTATTAPSITGSSTKRKKGMKKINKIIDSESDKSLEELEEIMNQRFTTTASKSTMEQSDHKKVSFNNKQNKHSLFNSNSNTNGKVQNYEKEYYDDDDEGYESYDVVIEKEERGGEQVSTSSTYKDEGIFFPSKPNPPQPDEDLTTAVETRITPSSDTNKSFFHSMTSTTPPPPLIPSPSQQTPTPEPKLIRKKEVKSPLLDETTGKPMTLTLDTIPPSTPEEDDEEDDIAYPKTFSEMSLSPKIIQNLHDELQCNAPLYVQQRSFPTIMDSTNNKNIVLATSTGSGKTLAFLLPIIQRFMESHTEGSKNINTIVVVPGRELASQINSVAQSMTKGVDTVNVGLCIGGTSLQRNVEMIRKKKPNLIIGTPGRISELLFGKIGASPKMKISPNQPNATFTLVLDEFDELFSSSKQLDSYTKQSTRQIYDFFRQRLPSQQTQVVFCSATALFDTKGFQMTFNEDKWKIIQHRNTDPEKKISLSPTTRHGIIHVSKKKKLDMLRRFMNTEPYPIQVLVFVNHASSVDKVVEQLNQIGIIAAPLHGSSTSTSSATSQERALVTKELRQGYIGLIITTEMVARGLDAPYLTHVVNYDIPTNAIHYAHRVGRVGRNGAQGIVVNFVENGFEEGIYRRFGKELGLDEEDSHDMCLCEPRGGKLVVLKE